MKYYVYALVDPRDDQPFYIGKGCGMRAVSHLRETLKATLNIRKYYKIQSIREDGHEPIVKYLFEGLEEDEAYEKEAAEISRYGRKDFDPNGILMNFAVDSRPPNRLGRPHKAETKEKMSLASRGRKKSPEHCASIGKSKAGENHPNWGKQLPDDRKEKIRQGNLGKTRSEQVRQNIARGHSVKYEIVSPEGKRRVLDSLMLKKLCDSMGLNKTAFTNACRAGKPYKGWSITRC